MGENDFKEFRRWFEAYRYKEAIIIDVRYNGGGYIDTKLIDLLERRPYQINRDRDSVPLERPLEGFYGKVVVLCNEYSFSDAEVFPSAIKIRKLGTVIGKQTLGLCHCGQILSFDRWRNHSTGLRGDVGNRRNPSGGPRCYSGYYCGEYPRG